MNEAITEVNKILAHLQGEKWGDLPEPLLISAQGKLSVYMANIGAMLANAIMAKELVEQAAKMKEADLFLAYKETEMTDGEAKMRARLETAPEFKAVISAKKELSDIKSVYDAVSSTVTAIQVTLRSMNREAEATKFQNR